MPVIVTVALDAVMVTVPVEPERSITLSVVSTGVPFLKLSVTAVDPLPSLIVPFVPRKLALPVLPKPLTARVPFCTQTG